MKEFELDWLFIKYDYKKLVLQGGFVLDDKPTNDRFILHLRQNIELFQKVVFLMVRTNIIDQKEAYIYIKEIEKMLDKIKEVLYER